MNNKQSNEKGSLALQTIFKGEAEAILRTKRTDLLASDIVLYTQDNDYPLWYDKVNGVVAGYAKEEVQIEGSRKPTDYYKLGERLLALGSSNYIQCIAGKDYYVVKGKILSVKEDDFKKTAGEYDYLDDMENWTKEQWQAEWLKDLNGQEVAAYAIYESVVLIEGDKVIRNGEVIDTLDTYEKVKALTDQHYDDEGITQEVENLDKEFGDKKSSIQIPLGTDIDFHGRTGKLIHDDGKGYVTVYFQDTDEEEALDIDEVIEQNPDLDTSGPKEGKKADIVDINDMRTQQTENNPNVGFDADGIDNKKKFVKGPGPISVNQGGGLGLPGVNAPGVEGAEAVSQGDLVLIDEAILKDEEMKEFAQEKELPFETPMIVTVDEGNWVSAEEVESPHKLYQIPRNFLIVLERAAVATTIEIEDPEKKIETGLEKLLAGEYRGDNPEDEEGFNDGVSSVLDRARELLEEERGERKTSEGIDFLERKPSVLEKASSEELMEGDVVTVDDSITKEKYFEGWKFGDVPTNKPLRVAIVINEDDQIYVEEAESPGRGWDVPKEYVKLVETFSDKTSGRIPGIPDGTGPMGGTPDCTLNDKTLPRVRRRQDNRSPSRPRQDGSGPFKNKMGPLSGTPKCTEANGDMLAYYRDHPKEAKYMKDLHVFKEEAQRLIDSDLSPNRREAKLNELLWDLKSKYGFEESNKLIKEFNLEEYGITTATEDEIDKTESKNEDTLQRYYDWISHETTDVGLIPTVEMTAQPLANAFPELGDGEEGLSYAKQIIEKFLKKSSSKKTAIADDMVEMKVQLIKKAENIPFEVGEIGTIADIDSSSSLNVNVIFDSKPESGTYSVPAECLMYVADNGKPVSGSEEVKMKALIKDERGDTTGEVGVSIPKHIFEKGMRDSEDYVKTYDLLHNQLEKGEYFTLQKEASKKIALTTEEKKKRDTAKPKVNKVHNTLISPKLKEFKLGEKVKILHARKKDPFKVGDVFKVTDLKKPYFIKLAYKRDFVHINDVELVK